MTDLRVLALLLSLYLGGAAAAQVVEVPPPAGRCLKDALERWYCANDPKGVAVIDNLGAVVCAPGRCVEVEDEWECSSVSGGNAERTPEGVRCDGECRAPRSVDCKLGEGAS